MAIGFINLHAHSDFSLLDGLSKPAKMADKCSRFDMGACAITDHRVLAGAPVFYDEMKKKGIKPILGVELDIYKNKTDRSTSHLVVLAKNLAGWKSLLKIVTASNTEENFYYRARITMEQLGVLNEGKNLIAFAGHCGSTLADAMWTNRNSAYDAKSYEEARSYVNMAEWEKILEYEIGLHQEVFGKENLVLEIQLIDAQRMFAAQILGKTFRHLGKKLGIPCIGTGDAHYVDKEDAVDQRILLCSNFHKKLSQVESAIANGEDTALGGFFKSNNYHLPTPSEMAELHTEDELKNTLEIASRIEDYDINNPPFLPQFDCPDGLSSADYLMKLCREGMNNYGFTNNKVYEDRLMHEFSVIVSNSLEDYFLIMSDIVRSAWDDGEITGPARGSAGGCLLSLVTGITHTIDPIEYNLLFDRFINIGRLGKKRELPDIDVDFMQANREKRIRYIVNKYGRDCVSNIATFGALKGKSALQTVLRVREACTAAEIKEISKCLPSDAAISDDLQEQLEEDGEKSVIQLALEDSKSAKALRKWVHLDKNGEICGDFAPYFKQAKRLEWVNATMGTHASAIIISDRPISDVAPMIRTKKTGELQIGVDHTKAASMGLLKVDILGCAALDKIHYCLQLINERYPGV